MNIWIIGGIVILGGVLASGARGEEIVLSPEQEAFIGNLHKYVRTKFRRFIKEAEKTGWKVLITSGYRTFAKQLQLKQENSNNASPGNSWHNYGMALDINLIRGNERVRKADSIGKWRSTGVPQIAESMGMTWGGDFATYHDPVHFDFRNSVGISINKLKELSFAQFGTNWENIQGNKVIFNGKI